MPEIIETNPIAAGVNDYTQFQELAITIQNCMQNAGIQCSLGETCCPNCTPPNINYRLPYVFTSWQTFCYLNNFSPPDEIKEIHLQWGGCDGQLIYNALQSAKNIKVTWGGTEENAFRVELKDLANVFSAMQI